MTETSNSVAATPDAPNLDQSFNESVGNFIATPEVGSDLASTARAEIQLEHETRQSLAQHDDHWQQLSHRLSSRPVAAPSLDMGESPNRSVTREYNERRQQWEGERNFMETSALTAKAGIRANGTTLTKEFLVHAENKSLSQNGTNKRPAHAQASDKSSQTQREFNVKAVSTSHHVNR